MERKGRPKFFLGCDDIEPIPEVSHDQSCDLTQISPHGFENGGPYLPQTTVDTIMWHRYTLQDVRLAPLITAGLGQVNSIHTTLVSQLNMPRSVPHNHQNGFPSFSGSTLQSRFVLICFICLCYVFSSQFIARLLNYGFEFHFMGVKTNFMLRKELLRFSFGYFIAISRVLSFLHCSEIQITVCAKTYRKVICSFTRCRWSFYLIAVKMLYLTISCLF